MIWTSLCKMWCRFEYETQNTYIFVWKWVNNMSQYLAWRGLSQGADKMVTTVLSLTWESPYLGKTVFILRQGPDALATEVTKSSAFNDISWAYPLITGHCTKWINSVKPDDAIWWHRCGSTLAQIMASCHDLNHCALIKGFLWHSSWQEFHKCS